MQIKTAVRYCFTPGGMVVIKTTKGSECGKGREKTMALVHCWWECKLPYVNEGAYYGKTV